MIALCQLLLQVERSTCLEVVIEEEMNDAKIQISEVTIECAFAHFRAAYAHAVE
jgi:hypothetical protein